MLDQGLKDSDQTEPATKENEGSSPSIKSPFVNLIVPQLDEVLSRHLAAGVSTDEAGFIEQMRQVGLNIRSEGLENGQIKLTLVDTEVQLSLNPEAWIPKLDLTESPYQAAMRHLFRQDLNRWDTLTHVARSMGPMLQECLLTVCIPVTTEEKIETFQRTIENLINQTADKRKFEIIILLNHPEKEDIDPTIMDQTFDTACQPFFEYIEKARERGLSILCCAQGAPASVISIGHLRSILASIAITRYQLRGEGYQNHLLMRADADMSFVEPTMIEQIIEDAHNNPDCLNFFGDLQPSPEALIEDPLLSFGYDLFGLIDRFFTSQGRKPCGGPHATTWLTTYVQSGGYIPFQECGEDVALDQTITTLAEGHKEITPFRYLNGGTKICTNTRRAEVAILLGLAPAVQWDQSVATFSATNPEVRSSTLLQHGKFEDLIKDPLLRIEIENSINQTVSVYEISNSFADQKVLSEVASLIENRYGIKLSITIDRSNNISNDQLNYRLIIEDLGGLEAWLLKEREDLIAEQTRMRSLASFYTPQIKPLATGLKY